MALQRSSDSDPTEAIVPLGGRIELRAGDDLPGFAAIVENDLGQAINLTGAKAYLIVRSERGTADVEPGAVVYRDEIKIVNAPAGVVQHDWSGIDTLAWGPGSFDLAVQAIWADPGGDPSLDTWVTAPSDRNVKLIIRPEGIH